jgi:hypothetical protein
MQGVARVIGAVVAGGFGLLCLSGVAGAQVSQTLQPVGRVASLAPGSIDGVVQDEKDAPVAGAMVSALGATRAFAVTDRRGRFELRTLSPGAYLVRAHLSGFIASPGRIVDVRPSARVSSSIALHRASSSSLPVLAAGVGDGARSSPQPAAEPAGEVAGGATNDNSGRAADDDHGETAWRLRHARRSILKDATLPEEIAADRPPGADPFDPHNFLGRAVGSPARAATSFFTETPFSGQFNLLTTGSFDSPQKLFANDSFARSIAYVAVSAPVGLHADWTMRGALTQGDISSWIVAGAYATRAPARHRYNVGLSYSTQRYDGGNPAALRDVTDGSRNAGALYGFDTFTITPGISLTYGGRYARYDYLADRGLISPRVALTVVPGEHVRLNMLVSRRALAPGAEEFVPPADSAIWLPPQRTFSSLVEGRGLVAEHTTHLDVELERDIAAAGTVSIRAFRQNVDDQLVTMFGIEIPRRPAAELGHYFVTNNGDVKTNGWSAALRTSFAEHVHGSIEYSLARAHWNPASDLTYMVLLASSATRRGSERIHDVASTLEADVPETATRVTVWYRVSNGFAHHDAIADRQPFDSRFDVQVRQSLPFMDFSSAKWEMLLAVRDVFREAAADQSIYDELLVVRPPKQIVGGLTLRF